MESLLINQIFFIRGQTISRVLVNKFLGVLIDDKMTFADHINKSCLKLSKLLGVIYRLSKFVSFDILHNY